MTDADSQADDSDESYEQLNVRVPAGVKEQAKQRLSHGGLTDAVQQRLEEIASGADERAALLDELEALRDERRELKTERDYLNDQLEDLEIKIERLERELEDLQQ